MARYTIETIKDKAKELNNNIEVLSDVYVNAKEPLQMRCKECGFEFECSWSNFKNNPTCRQEEYDWQELCDYVFKEILKYKEDMKFPKNLALRLKGLRDGVFMANKRSKPLANYSYKVILTTFKACKIDILRAFKDTYKFKDENHKINYMMVVIENNINDIYLKILKTKKQEEVMEETEVNGIDFSNRKRERKSQTTISDRLKGMI